MKYFLAIILISFPLFAKDIAVRQKFAAYGGLSVFIGDGSEDVNPGINAGIETIAKVGKFYGIGGSIEYTWLTEDLPPSAPEDKRSSLHYWDASVIQKVFYDINDNVNIFGEFAPGFYYGLWVVRNKYNRAAARKPGFGLSFGTGVHAKSFIFVFNFKAALDRAGYRRIRSIKWITFSIGYSGD